jgi:hypothetical protein
MRDTSVTRRGFPAGARRCCALSTYSDSNAGGDQLADRDCRPRQGIRSIELSAKLRRSSRKVRRHSKSNFEGHAAAASGAFQQERVPKGVRSPMYSVYEVQGSSAITALDGLDKGDEIDKRSARRGRMRESQGRAENPSAWCAVDLGDGRALKVRIRRWALGPRFPVWFPTGHHQIGRSSTAGRPRRSTC